MFQYGTQSILIIQPSRLAQILTEQALLRRRFQQRGGTSLGQGFTGEGRKIYGSGAKKAPKKLVSLKFLNQIAYRYFGRIHPLCGKILGEVGIAQADGGDGFGLFIGEGARREKSSREFM
jgi:hypothetical protein